MRGREHVVIGAGTVAVAGIGASLLGMSVSWPSIIGACVSAAAGSLAPDIDHPTSLASFGVPSMFITGGAAALIWSPLAKKSALFSGMTLSSGLITLAWIAVAFGVALIGLSLVAGMVFRHRGPVHSLVFGLATTCGVAAATVVLSGSIWTPVCFAWGWIAHLAADSTTPKGVPDLLWPLKR